MSAPQSQPVHVIGGGLAGSEAAWQIASRFVPVVLHEMRPLQTTAAHKTGRLAELVCSNSFRSDDADMNAVGLLHEEMRRLGSLVMRTADANRVPAGSALAVDREGFAAAITAALAAHPLINIRREQIDKLPPPEWDSAIVATVHAGGDDLGHVLRLALVVIPPVGVKPTFDVDEFPLLEVLLANLPQLAPGVDIEPVGILLLSAPSALVQV